MSLPEFGNSLAKVAAAKSTGKLYQLISIDGKKLSGTAASRKEMRRVTLADVVARRAKPKEWAKVAGRPWSVTISGGASDGRALRASRCSQERRQCARCARVKMFSVGRVTGDGAKVVLLVKPTVSLRTRFRHSRRMRQRGQSFHTTGASGSGSGVSSRVGEESERGDSSSQNTALTRRGLIVVLLS